MTLKSVVDLNHEFHELYEFFLKAGLESPAYPEEPRWASGRLEGLGLGLAPPKLSGEDLVIEN